MAWWRGRSVPRFGSKRCRKTKRMFCEKDNSWGQCVILAARFCFCSLLLLGRFESVSNPSLKQLGNKNAQYVRERLTNLEICSVCKVQPDVAARSLISRRHLRRLLLTASLVETFLLPTLHHGARLLLKTWTRRASWPFYRSGLKSFLCEWGI